MILRTAYVRFFRAFNYDFLRNRHHGYEPDLWDRMEDGTNYPYISLEIDPKLTAVVGANESGKSQLLQAIEHALGTKKSVPADFCRYSDYFTVAEEMKIPHFGLHFGEVTNIERDIVLSSIDDTEINDVSSFRIFRTHHERLALYIRNQRFEITDLERLTSIFPKVFRIDPERAIPNSVPIEFLVKRRNDINADPGPARTDRWALTDPLVENLAQLLPLAGNAQALASTIQNIFASGISTIGLSEREALSHRSQLDLAFDLLVTVGGIHTSAFVELQTALRNDDEGLANGIVSKMNHQLEGSLNLAKWWSQDQRFRLAIAVRDYDIVFTIQDRTGSQYSFAERSGGLKYFLSYLVQFLAHTKDRSGAEILLMDEPDAYLSNLGQQDLLRVLQEFTTETESAPGGQVVYVTHSPFLIDKNRADRIRVLDKGFGGEGVRVVRDVGRNHFEPLRTALGGFVGETAFIGNCNLIVEGLADQIYLAGMSDLLSRDNVASTERLDLNRITLVPAGAASHVPYMTFLARGRDADKPAVIVLLDGDEAGTRAVKELERGGPRGKRLIRPEYIAQLTPGRFPDLTSERPEGPKDIEDLIPIEIGLEAAKEYLTTMDAECQEDFPSLDCVKQKLSKSTGVFKAIQEGIDRAGYDFHLSKLGFARYVLSICSRTDSETVAKMKARFAVLFSGLTEMQRKAEREREKETITARVDREVTTFLRDRLETATKADVVVLLERIEEVIDSSIEGDNLLTGIRRLKEDFQLNSDRNQPISDRQALNGRLAELKYAELYASQGD